MACQYKYVGVWGVMPTIIEQILIDVQCFSFAQEKKCVPWCLEVAWAL